MEFLSKINSNGFEVIVSLLLANFIAQAFKTIRVAYQRRQVNLSIFFATGGMPSSHSSTVTAMATTVGLIDGASSVTFAIALCLATVVMFDAAGVRRAASIQAKVMNQILKELFSTEHRINKDKLKEFLGHTPTEVLAGAILGILVAFALRYWIAASVV